MLAVINDPQHPEWADPQILGTLCNRQRTSQVSRQDKLSANEFDYALKPKESSMQFLNFKVQRGGPGNLDRGISGVTA
jgi:hypothetical protein